MDFLHHSVDPDGEVRCCTYAGPLSRSTVAWSCFVPLHCTLRWDVNPELQLHGTCMIIRQPNQRQGNRYCLNDHQFIGTPCQGQDSRFVGTGCYKLVFLWEQEVANQFSSFAHS